MIRAAKTAATAAVIAAGGQFASSADAGWGYTYAAPSYYHAPPVGAYYSGAGVYPRYGYSAGYAPAAIPAPLPGYAYPAPAYAAPYAPMAYPAPAYAAPYSYGAPIRGNAEYDIYTPSGRQEVNYRYRNGMTWVDIDD